MSVGQHLSEVSLDKYEQELLQDPGIQDAYVDFEMQRLDEQLLAQNRLLTEVDHLLALRVGPNQFVDTKDVLQNMETSMQEQAMPYAVTTTEHDIDIEKNTKERIVRWLGMTAVQVAVSGYDFHAHESARERVAVEIDEAYRASTHQDDGTMRVFVSPRMSRKDASLEVARSEHLGDDDAIRVSWVKTLPDGSQKRVLQSILVRDIPLSAWVAMFEDSNNIFGRSMSVEDSESALSIMKLHDQLDIDMDKLPHGPISVIEAVIPYIDDAQIRMKVIEQSKKYYGDQTAMQREAEAKAKEWLVFDKELAESLYNEQATSKIKSFVYSLQHEWSKKDLATLKRHELPYAGYRMTRELAAMLESAQQKILAGRAALTSNPEYVLKKLGGDTRQLQQLQDVERLIAVARHEGMNQNQLLAMHVRAIASNNIDGGGGGCAGSSSTEFGKEDDPFNDEYKGFTESVFDWQESEQTEDGGACEYSGTFCYCCPYNSDGSDASKPYEVTIIRDEKGTARCTRGGCGATMKGDTVTDKGGIYKKAQEHRKNEQFTVAA